MLNNTGKQPNPVKLSELANQPLALSGSLTDTNSKRTVWALGNASGTPPAYRCVLTRVGPDCGSVQSLYRLTSCVSMAA